MPDFEIPAILQALERYSGKYEQEAVEAALAHREELIPIFIDSLEKVADNPTHFLEDLEYYLYMYGVMLLGHFREPRAHAAIVKVFSLPGPVLDQLFGDLVTENLPTILYNTSDGDFESIKSLVLNRRADAYTRGSAAIALTYAVATGKLPREEVLTFFSTLFTGDEAGQQSPFWSLMVNCILDLQPAGFMPIIDAAAEKGLLDGGFLFAGEDFSWALAISVDESLERLRQKMQRRSLDDLHGEMSWWSSSDHPRPPLLPPIDPPTAKGKKDKKSKKKTTKASKRKNRR